jgi:type IV pilus assembly protein PilM
MKGEIMLKFSRYAGIDMGNKTIKIVQLEKCKNKIRIKNILSIPNLSQNPFYSKEALSENLNAVFDLIKGHLRKQKITIGIPNDRVLYKKIELPKMRPGELKQAILWEKRELLAQLEGEYVVDYEVIKTHANSYEILMAASLKGEVIEYVNTARKFGLALEAIDIYPLSIARVFKSSFPEHNLAVVDIGAARTEITLFDCGKVDFTYSVPTGGDDMTKLIAKSFSLNESEAESIKKNPGNYQNEVKECLTPLIHHLTLQIIRCIKYFQQRKGEEVKTAVFTGGGGKLLGLKDYFFNETRIEVFLAHELDFPNIEIDPNLKSGFDKMEFSCALGYALRGVF